MSKELEDKQYYIDIVENLNASEMYSEAREVEKLIEHIFTPPTADEIVKELNYELDFNRAKWECIKDKGLITFKNDKDDNEIICLMNGIVWRLKQPISDKLAHKITTFFMEEATK